MTNEEYWYWLSNIHNIGIKKTKALLAYFSTPREMYHAKEEELNKIINLQQKDKEAIIFSRNEDTIKRSLEKLKENQIEFITIDNPNYPQRLKNIDDFPYAIYLKGNLPKEEKPSIAIIGARVSSNYGREIARYLSEYLAREGIQIISGLARGIDSASHLGALSANEETFGILGCGINRCYPPENISLYMDIIQSGGIISEYGLDVSPKAGNFPMRNRIISGLSDGIVVVEAKEKSGSLITVDFGLEQGKNIYAVPGRIDSLAYKGTNKLIQMGAKLIIEPRDIIEDFQMISNKKQQKNINTRKKENNLLDNNGKIVYANLSLEPKHINAIIKETKLSHNEVCEALVDMEMNDHVKRIGKDYYAMII